MGKITTKIVRYIEDKLGSLLSKKVQTKTVFQILSPVILYTDYRYWMSITQCHFSKVDTFPKTQEEILSLSIQHQKDWRFEREKLLMQHAASVFPDWQYIHERMEWHSRPVFHRDPKKSKTQPRVLPKPPRNSQHVSSKKTLSSLCFVTASGSDQPYFDLSVQLLESLKATRWYNNIPIKVLDCGLTQEDKVYLEKRFNVEVKDPGWDVPPTLIRDFDSHASGWKGCTARPYIHKHFPGYNYYFWIDTDTWIQDETGLDYVMKLVETQKIVCIDEGQQVKNHYFQKTAPSKYSSEIAEKQVIYNGLFCCHREALELYQKVSEDCLKELKEYRWGFDMITFTYLLHHFFPKATLLSQQDFRVRWDALKIDSNRYFINQKFVTPSGLVKYFPYIFLFSNKNTFAYLKGITISIALSKLNNKLLAEDVMHKYCTYYGYQTGNFFWRIYE